MYTYLGLWSLVIIIVIWFEHLLVFVKGHRLERGHSSITGMPMLGTHLKHYVTSYHDFNHNVFNVQIVFYTYFCKYKTKMDDRTRS